MVSVRRAWLLVLLCGLPLVGVRAALQVEPSSAEIAYGQTLTLTVRVTGSNADLRHLDLTPLQEDFRIEQRTPDADGTALQLTLNPRRMGALSIPPLWFAGMRSEPQPLQVTAPTDLDRTLQVSTTIGQTHVWQRQQVLITLSVRSSDRFFQLHAPAFTTSQVGATVLTPQLRTGRERDTDYVVRTSGWALYPNAKGVVTLDPPPVEYLRGGRVQARFALPRITLTVRALPPYVPGDMPVGRLAIHSRLDAERLLQPGTLGFWHVQVRGEGMPAAALPSPLAPVRDRARVQFLPAEVQRHEQTTAQGLEAQATFRIPFTATASGPVQLPALQLQYFDPGQGRIERVAIAARTRWALGWGWRLSGLLLALLLAVYGARRLLRHGRRLRSRRRRRRQAIRDVAAATRARDIRLALYRFGVAEGWHLDGSLQRWAAQFTQRFRTEGELRPLCAALNRLEFSGHGPDAKELERTRAQTLAVLRRARRRRVRHCA